MCLGGDRMTQAVRHLEVCSPSTDVDCSSSNMLRRSFHLCSSMVFTSTAVYFCFFLKLLTLTFLTTFLDFLARETYPCCLHLKLFLRVC